MRFLIHAGLAIAACAFGCHGEPCRAVHDLDFPAVEPRSYRDEEPTSTQRIAVFGDTQRTSFAGCLLGNEVNDAEQRVLLEDVARRKPGAIVLLGDMVFQGDSPRHWAYFDHLMSRARLDDVPVFPVLGNHDYLASKGHALRNAQVRFKQLENATHHGASWGGVRLLFLDTNRFDGSWERQRRWLTCELARADRGCARGVLVFAHQSPFTQSPWAPDDEGVQRHVLPLFCGSRSALAFISAHAHGYERWMEVPIAGCRERRIPFVVSAGAGGPRPPCRRRSAEDDDADLDEWPRPFNYLLLAQSRTGVTLDVYVLRKGEHAVRRAASEALDLPLREPGPAANCEACVP